MLNRTLISVLCLLAAASLCQAEKKQIKLKDGTTVVGEVVEQNAEGVKVKGQFATVFYPQSKIASIEAVYDVRQDYAERLAKLKKDDFDAQVAIGQWAMSNKLFPESVKHLEDALKLKSDERARLLLRQAQASRDEAAGTAKPAAAQPGSTAATDSGTIKYDPAAMVADDDIRRIRLAELSEKDRVSVEFRKNVLDRFLEQIRGRGRFDKAGAEAEFRSLPPSRKVQIILDETLPDDAIREDIVIKTDPAVMREFRMIVWREIANNCATAACHGSVKGEGGLKLWNLLGRNDNVDYTNFLILDSFRTKKGGDLIRRDGAGESLLLQFGLPATLAQQRHPKEIKPMFTSKSAKNYKDMESWIGSLKGPLRPDYGIKTPPPFVMKRVDALSGIPEKKADAKDAKTPAKDAPAPKTK